MYINAEADNIYILDNCVSQSWSYVPIDQEYKFDIYSNKYYTM